MVSIERLLSAIWFTPTRWGWGLPVVFWGMPGVGKSDRIAAHARLYNGACKILAPGEQGEAGFGTVPVPVAARTLNPSDMRLVTPAPDWVDLFEDAGGSGVLFTDELTTAPPAIFPALMGLLLARRIGNYQLPRGVRVIAAANPPEALGGAGYDLAMTTANRLGHFQWPSTSANDWVEWLLSASEDGEEPASPLTFAAREQEVLQAWPEPFARAKGLVAGFIRANAALLNCLPPVNSPQRSRAWPSQRTWTMATLAMASAEVHGFDSSSTDEMIAAFVGEAAAMQFITFRQAADLPDPRALLDGSVTWKHDAHRPDRSFATLASLVAFLQGEKRRIGNAPDTTFVARAERCWVVLDEVGTLAPDVTISAARKLVELGLSTLKSSERPVRRLRELMALAK